MNRSNDRYSSSPRIGIVDVAIMSFLRIFVVGVFSLSFVELMYPEQIEPL
jgi:hypothetical protein